LFPTIRIYFVKYFFLTEQSKTDCAKRIYWKEFIENIVPQLFRIVRDYGNEIYHALFSLLFRAGLRRFLDHSAQISPAFNLRRFSWFLCRLVMAIRCPSTARIAGELSGLDPAPGSSTAFHSGFDRSTERCKPGIL
jgi:hypothetical protein